MTLGHLEPYPTPVLFFEGPISSAGGGSTKGRYPALRWRCSGAPPSRWVRRTAFRSIAISFTPSPNRQEFIPVPSRSLGGDFFRCSQERMGAPGGCAHSKRVITVGRGSPHRLLQCDRCIDAMFVRGHALTRARAQFGPRFLVS